MRTEKGRGKSRQNRKEHPFLGQDLLCELFLTGLERTTKLWQPSKTPAVVGLADPKPLAV